MTEFVGRADELKLLHGILAETQAGQGHTVLITGDGGIGKTRLVQELAADAGKKGWCVLSGRCISLSEPDAAFAAFLKTLNVRQASGQSALSPVSSWDGPHQPVAVAQALLDRRPADTPAMLVLEDLQWADGAILDVFTFLAWAINGRPVLLVGTYRNEEVGPQDRLSQLAAELLRAGDASELDLAPLSPVETAHLLQDLLEGRPSDDLIATVVARSSGNPFFATQLVTEPEGYHGLPSLLRHVLLQRVHGVPPDARRVLLTASAFDGTFSYHQLALTTGLRKRRLSDVLRQLVSQGLLIPDLADGQYRFRHPLLAEAMYSTILPGEKERVHKDIAQRLTDAITADGPEVAAGDIVRHWLIAHRPTEALLASLRAAEDAELAGDTEGALHHLRCAHDQWSQVPRAGELAGTDEATLLARLADLADRTDAVAEAAEFATQALDRLDPAVHPLRRARLLRDQCHFLLSSDDVGAALAASRRAADLIPARPASADRARVLATLAIALVRAAEYEEADRVAGTALKVARQVYDPRLAVPAHGALALAMAHSGRFKLAHEYGVRGHQQAVDHGGAYEVTQAVADLCEVLIVSGRAHEVAQVAGPWLAGPEPHDSRGRVWVLLATCAAEAYLHTGRWDRAEELLAEVGVKQKGPAARHTQLVHANLAVLRGDWAEALDCLKTRRPAALRPAAAVLEVRVSAEMALWTNDPDHAADLVDSLLAERPVRRNPVLMAQLGALGLRAQADRVQVAASVRDLPAIAAAQRHAKQLLAMTCRAAERAVLVTPEAEALRAAAEAEHARAQQNDDVGTWSAVVAAWEVLDREYDAAYSRWRLAETLLLRAPGAEDLVRVTRQAHQVATALGARPLQQEVEAFARRARVDLVKGTPQADLRAGSDNAFGLTAREDQVLELVVRGYTNRQIGTELNISTKTASVHVTHILQKLGVTRRAEAGALAHRLYSAAAPGPRFSEPSARHLEANGLALDRSYGRLGRWFSS